MSAVLGWMMILGLTAVNATPQQGVIWIASYLRSEPVLSDPVKANVIKIVPKETRFDLLKFDKGWFLIQVDDSTQGWVYRKLIKVLDESGNEIADYDPYDDKGWKTGATGATGVTGVSGSTSSTGTSEPKKSTEPKPSKPAPSKPAAGKPKTASPSHTKLPASLDKQIKVADSLVKIGCRIDSLNQTVTVIKDDLKAKESILNEINERIRALESRDSSMSAQMESLSKGKQNYLLLIILIIAAFIAMAILIPLAMRRSRTLVNQVKVDQDSKLDQISTKVNTNFVRLSVSSRKDYHELLDSLTVLGLLDDTRIADLMEESSAAKGSVDKMSPEILNYLNEKDFAENLSNLLNLYLQYDPTALRNKKMTRLNEDLSGVVKELGQHLKTDDESRGKAPKPVADWFKSLQAALDGAHELSEDFGVMIGSGKYTSLLNQLKKNFPAEAANINLSLQNKKWKQAQTFLEKMEIEKVKYKD